ncbi:diguanylate cyclase domain-containing protein [Microvirga antarctica]|uniref:diguanylate cyclase domain-containing protein n=1 Tax=Microvirga antarctica TaxID=2819233 RepID=UPI001B3078DF|nr:diguanylate cyclase [Microvirga antarctica]
MAPTNETERDFESLTAFVNHRYGTIASLLDSLGIAVCIFDGRDKTLLWNDTFLLFFPDHRGRISVGEHYRLNLRRFYESRLERDEIPFIDEYIERGLARHRSQQRPYIFEHHGRWVRVAVHTLPDVGRVRIWTEVPPPLVDGEAPQRGRSTPADLAHLTPYNSLPDAIVVLDRGGKILTFNDQFRTLYRLSTQDAISGRTFAEVLRGVWQQIEGGEETFDRQVLPVLREEQRFAGVAFEIPLPEDRWVRIIEQRSMDGEKTCVHFDISAFRQEQRQLQAAEAVARAEEQRFRAVIDRSPVGMSINAEDGSFREVNAAFCRILGYTAGDLVGRALWDVIDPADRAKAMNTIGQLVAGAVAAVETEMLFIRRDGSRRSIVYSGVHLREDGAETVVISQIQDVTAQREAEAERDSLVSELGYLANHDPLTGLPNRRAFEEALRRILVAEDGQQPRSHALCYIDLDDFKNVNDTAGHAAGDALLRQVSLAMNRLGRSSDTIARLGGDEFGLLLVDCGAAQAERIANRLIEAVSQAPLDWDRMTFSVGASIGIAPFRSSDAFDDILKRADFGCYRAKRAGGNRASLVDLTSDGKREG